MSKTIASLLFVSGLCLAPFMVGAGMNFTSTAYAVEQEQVVTTSEADEDLAYVDPDIDEEVDVADLEADQDIQPHAPSVGFAMPIEVAVESTQSAGAPITGIAVALQPEVTESVAHIIPAADETVQTASDTTDMANVSQMVSNFADMNGKLVMDRNGDLMGTVVGVNDETTTIEVELTDGRMITLLDLPLNLGEGFVSVDLTDVDFDPVGDADDLLRIDCQ